jgi:subtilisin family serine protease
MPVLPDTAVGENAEPGQLVIFAGDAKGFDRALRQLAGEFEATVSRIDKLPAFNAAFAVLQFAPGKPVAPLRAEMARRMPDWIVEPNTRLFALQTGASAVRPRLYATAAIRLPADAAFARGVRVGLVDSAVERISALAGTRIVQREFVPRDLAGSQEHGTALAALIAGDLQDTGFFGIARGCSLAVAAVMRDADKNAGLAARTNVGLLAPALDWLLSQRVQVVNLSLGGESNAVVGRLVREILKRGVAIVAAGGNGGPDAPPVYPAAYPGVIAVTAADAGNRIYPRANRGDYLVLTAPGVDVWVPVAGVGRYVSGTSYAAAIVSGAVAVHLARNVAGQGSMTELCRHATDLGERGRDPGFGCGLLQLPRP